PVSAKDSSMPDRATSREPRTVQEIAQHARLSDQASALLQERLTARDYLTLLDEKGLYSDGIRFAAHWLPKRAAHWWGCLCLWRVYRSNVPAKEVAALHAVVNWVREPSDDQRRHAKAAGDIAG